MGLPTVDAPGMPGSGRRAWEPRSKTKPATGPATLPCWACAKPASARRIGIYFVIIFTWKYSLGRAYRAAARRNHDHRGASAYSGAVAAAVMGGVISTARRSGGAYDH